ACARDPAGRLARAGQVTGATQRLAPPVRLFYFSMNIPSRIARRLSIVGGLLSLLLTASPQLAHAADTMLKPDAKADSTAAIQTAIDNAASVVVFPAGTYRTGSLTIPAGVTLRFDAKAKLVPI